MTIQVVHNDKLEEPFHVRVISDGNSKVLLWGENLHNREDALNELVAVATAFGVKNPSWGTSKESGEYWLESNGSIVFMVEFAEEEEEVPA